MGQGSGKAVTPAPPIPIIPYSYPASRISHFASRIDRSRGGELVRIVFLWLHVVAAAVWLGSLVFLALGVLPVLRRPEYRAVYGPILHAVGLRYRWIGWTALAVLVSTGLHNLAALGFGWSDVVSGQIWAGPFGRALAWKLVLVGVIVGLNLVHDLWLGPRVTRRWQANPDDPSLRWVRPAAAWLGRLVVLLTLGVFYLAVTLTRGGLP